MYSGMARLIGFAVPGAAIAEPAGRLVPVVEEGKDRGGGGGIHLRERDARCPGNAARRATCYRVEHAAPLAGKAARAVGAAEHEVHDGALARDLPAEPFVGHEHLKMPLTTLWCGDSTPAYHAPVAWSWRASSHRCTKSVTASRGCGPLRARQPRGYRRRPCGVPLRSRLLRSARRDGSPRPVEVQLPAVHGGCAAQVSSSQRRA